MRIRTTDAIKALVLLAAVAGAGCSLTRPAAAPQSVAAGGNGVEPRIAPARVPTADDDCATARNVVQGSTRYVYQGVGHLPREDNSVTSNLGGAPPGHLAATGERVTSAETSGPPAAAKKPGCPD